VFAAYGEKRRELCKEVPTALKELQGFENAQLVMPGVIALQTKKFESNAIAKEEMKTLNEQLTIDNGQLSGVAQIIICDDSSFVAATLNNYLWVTYTRSNPSHDMYGIDEFIIHKHWGCNGPMVVDARVKPHHAPPVEKVPAIEKQIDRLFDKGGSLYGVLK
jgi:4-hydroxy-3-polyprenylbenzoate decarboxylase